MNESVNEDQDDVDDDHLPPPFGLSSLSFILSLLSFYIIWSSQKAVDAVMWRETSPLLVVILDDEEYTTTTDTHLASDGDDDLHSWCHVMMMWFDFRMDSAGDLMVYFCWYSCCSCFCTAKFYSLSPAPFQLNLNIITMMILLRFFHLLRPKIHSWMMLWRLYVILMPHVKFPESLHLVFSFIIFVFSVSFSKSLSPSSLFWFWCLVAQQDSCWGFKKAHNRKRGEEEWDWKKMRMTDYWLKTYKIIIIIIMKYKWCETTTIRETCGLFIQNWLTSVWLNFDPPKPVFIILPPILSFLLIISSNCCLHSFHEAFCSFSLIIRIYVYSSEGKDRENTRIES